MLDNLAAHKVAVVREAIAAVCGTIMDLPPNPPDWNPIDRFELAECRRHIHPAAISGHEKAALG